MTHPKLHPLLLLTAENLRALTSNDAPMAPVDALFIPEKMCFLTGFIPEKVWFSAEFIPEKV